MVSSVKRIYKKEQKEKTMEKVKNYIQLHLNILLFSLTSVFSKMASVQYNKHGLEVSGFMCFWH